MNKTLHIEGMTCANCALSVTKTIEKKGGKNVNVDFISGEADFEVKDAVEIEDITEAVNSIGYHVSNHAAGKKKVRQGHNLTLRNRMLVSITCSIPLLLSMFINLDGYIQLLLTIPIMLAGTLQFGKTSIGSIKSGVANMDVLVMLGSYASFMFSIYNLLFTSSKVLYFESAGLIITFVFIGKFIEKRSLLKATDSINSFSKLLPNEAIKVSSPDDLEGLKVTVDELKIGDLVLIKDGSKIPVDGKILSGNGYLNEAMLSGESQPIDKKTGDRILAGTINTNGNFVMMALKTGQNTYLKSIIDVVAQARKDKPEIQKSADKIAAVFVPVVVIIAVLTFILWYVFTGQIDQALINATAVLVISCPCAMGLATPTAITVALGKGAKNGIFIKSSARLEALASIKNVLFDKTGTITAGQLKISSINQKSSLTEQELINIAYGLELISSHPIAKSIKMHLKQRKKLMQFINHQEIKGKGVTANDFQGNNYQIGNFTSNNLAGISIYKNDELVGEIVLEDEVRADAETTISYLKSIGLHIAMVSGDKKKICSEINAQLKLNEVFFELLPEQKLNVVKKFNSHSPTLFVGDGINDAPSLSIATVGVSLAKATEVAISSSDIIIAESTFFKSLKQLFSLSKNTLKIIKQNLFWAFFYNALAIPIAAFGFLNPMIAAGAMSLSSLFVVSNSLRVKV